MESYNLANPDSNVMELLHCLEKSGSVRLTNLVRVEILDGLDVASLQKTVVKKAVTRPDNNAFHCPKCGMAQRKSKHGDLCWRCQKKADEINKSHAPVDDPAQHVRSQEVEPMFAAGAGVRVASDGHIGARKLG
jgi:ribosomal protein L37AE/L43A